ncbi:MAG: flagellar hook capping protein, partial [Gorillibacterium sp.]|nr:flagellar hook capping protein [Gorillibacterium sp.]
VEQMTKVADEVKLLRQSSGISPELIDKKVTWNVTATDNTISEKSGIVTGIVIKKGLQYVMVDGKEISIDLITKVQKPEVEADE